MKALPGELSLLNQLPPLAISPKVSTPMTVASVAGMGMCVAHHYGVNVDFSAAVGIVILLFGIFGWLSPTLAVVKDPASNQGAASTPPVAP